MNHLRKTLSSQTLAKITQNISKLPETRIYEMSRENLDCVKCKHMLSGGKMSVMFRSSIEGLVERVRKKTLETTKFTDIGKN